MKLKRTGLPAEAFSGRSDVLTVSKVPNRSDPRAWYLERPYIVSPPCISCSDFVPEAMIEHLMRNKKNSALGVKFQPHRTTPDAITNMEGALHTFVTPIVLALVHGDYVYRGGHGMTKFEPVENMQQARMVIVSAQIQPDFEGPDVMLALSALEADDNLRGLSLPDDFLSSKIFSNTEAKQDAMHRKSYDMLLKRHMVAHLTKAKYLPSITEVAAETIDLTEAVNLLERAILTSSDILDGLDKLFLRLPQGSVLSLELLFNTALHQLRNELSALDAMARLQGYVYTSDPPSIFAREIGAEILNRLQFAALKRLASENSFFHMRVFAFNDYADRMAITLLKAALSSQPQVMVLPKHALFNGPRNTYSALPGCEGALLVIHNNSDAFGQNIETEWESGSMDGAIGANSSVAASLKRDRSDLLSMLM